ncbi:MAG: hypothetical protein ACRYG4_27300, partial [Janthinobacterium lividum]
RMGVKCLPPCINASGADFIVEGSGEGAGVRYALAALKGVGEKAMATMAEERVRGGRFAGLAEFARRVDPKLLNKRQLESLVGGGAFDGIEPNRGGVHALAEAVLGTAQNAAAARESAQVAMFGESTDRGLAMLVSPGVRWSLAETMAHEKDAFGFYFSGHPVEGFAHVLAANKVRTYAQAAASEPPPGGGRLPVTLAGLIEEAKWRSPQNGKSDKYLMVTMSDASGQYVASAFDESAQTAILAAVAAADAVLVSGELLWRPGEDTPRVTIRGIQSLAVMAARSRCRLTVELAVSTPLDALATLFGGRRGGRGELVVHVPLAGGGRANLLLGRDFSIDNEIFAKVERMRGVDRAELTAVS